MRRLLTNLKLSSLGVLVKNEIMQTETGTAEIHIGKELEHMGGFVDWNEEPESELYKPTHSTPAFFTLTIADITRIQNLCNQQLQDPVRILALDVKDKHTPEQILNLIDIIIDAYKITVLNGNLSNDMMKILFLNENAYMAFGKALHKVLFDNAQRQSLSTNNFWLPWVRTELNVILEWVRQKLKEFMK